MTTNDADWLEDVRRWYFNGARTRPASPGGEQRQAPSADLADVGYEAAHPSLQSAGWPKPPASNFGRFG